MADQEEWEEVLRRCLSDQAGGAPPTRTDFSGRAIRAARSIHRRRTMLGLASVVAATLLVTGAWTQGWLGTGQPGREFGAVTGRIDDSVRVSTQPASPLRLATDEHLPRELGTELLGPGVSGDTVLATAGDSTLDLSGVRQVTGAQRLGEGWVVTAGQPGRQRLWWIVADHRPVALLAGMDAITVAGVWVSWQRGALLSAATISPEGRLTGRVSTTAADVVPVGMLGDAVLLRSDPALGTVGWDTWRPAAGEYRPAWNREVVRVYGPMPDGSTAVGLVPQRPGSDRLCLARIEVAPTLPVVGRHCLPGALADELSATAPAAVSPQGRWLITGAATDPLLVDLSKLGDGAESVTPLAGVVQPATTPAWSGDDRAVLASEDQLVQVLPERIGAGVAAAVRSLPLAGAPPVVVESG